MEHLYTPWRSDYIHGKTPQEGCFFCLHQKSKNDEENLVLFRGDTSFVLLNLYPYTDGHLLIAPYRHIAQPNDLSKEEWIEIHELARRGIAALEKVSHPEGFNLGMNLGRVAGAGVVGHLHLHVVPRWNGDTNFMPILAQTKMINENLHTVYKKLKSAF